MLLFGAGTAGAQNKDVKNKSILIASDEAFLKRNASKPGIMVTSSGLQYKVVKKGTGAKPRKFDKVQINFTLNTLEGKIVGGNGNNIWNHRMDKMTYGMAEAVRLMPVGSKWILYMPPGLCNSKIGSVGDGRVLVCSIELVAITKE